jgi:drug/metabolite transporter (DMT)-like permease
MAFSLGVLYGVIALLGWGISDFLVKLAVEKEDYYKVLFYTQAIGAVLILAYLAFFLGFQALTGSMIVILLVLGFLWTSAFVAFYKGLEIGKLSIISPISSSWGMVAALIGIFVFSEAVTPARAIGIALAITGIALASTSFSELRKSKRHVLLKGVEYAVYDMLAWGAMFAVLANVIKELGPIAPLLYLKLFLLASLLLAAPIKKKSLGLPAKSIIPLVALVGLLELVAPLSFNYGLTSEFVSIVSPIGAAFPAVTVILAYVFLKERLELNQKIGIAAIVLGLVLMALV